MSHFIINWGGNKRREFKYIENHLSLDNKINIIEPFCGSSAISFGLWLKHGNKFNYYLNDLDEDLFKIYEVIKNDDIDELYDKLNNIISQSNTKETFKEMVKVYKNDKDIYKRIALLQLGFRKNCFYTIDNKYLNKNNIKPTKLNLLFFDFIKSSNVFISNDDWCEFYNRHKDNNQSLIILDPPYIDSDNIHFYKKKCRNLNVYDKLDDIKNDKATSIFIIEKTDVTQELFKDWNTLTEYDKMYVFKKRKTIHIMYSNL